MGMTHLKVCVKNFRECLSVDMKIENMIWAQYILIALSI